MKDQPPEQVLKELCSSTQKNRKFSKNKAADEGKIQKSLSFGKDKKSRKDEDKTTVVILDRVRV